MDLQCNDGFTGHTVVSYGTEHRQTDATTHVRCPETDCHIIAAIAVVIANAAMHEDLCIMPWGPRTYRANGGDKRLAKGAYISL